MSIGIWAHRGAHGDAAPENSLAAFKRASQLPCHGVELDVQRTADGVWVVFHDRTLKRLCGVTHQVRRLSHTELKGHPLPNGEPVPTLDEVLDLLRPTALHVNVEIKLRGTEARDFPGCDTLLASLRAFPSHRLVLSSFHVKALLPFREHVEVAWLLRRVNRQSMRTLVAHHIPGLHVHHGKLRSLPAALRISHTVRTWTVNRLKDLRRAARSKPDGIITDVPELAHAIAAQST